MHRLFKRDDSLGRGHHDHRSGSTRRLALAALAWGTCALASAGLSPSVQAEPRAFGSAYHGPRVVAPAPVFRVGPGRGGHGGYRGGHHGHGHHGWGGLGLGLGLGIGALLIARPWEPVVVERPTYYYPDPPPPPGYPPPVQSAPQPVPPVAPAPSRPPEPIVYPSQGQSPERTEADRQDCNRWATSQPSAMADASVFHRATIACLEGRGYTVR